MRTLNISSDITMSNFDWGDGSLDYDTAKSMIELEMLTKVSKVSSLAGTLMVKSFDMKATTHTDKEYTKLKAEIQSISDALAIAVLDRDTYRENHAEYFI